MKVICKNGDRWVVEGNDEEPLKCVSGCKENYDCREGQFCEGNQCKPLVCQALPKGHSGVRINLTINLGLKTN